MLKITNVTKVYLATQIKALNRVSYSFNSTGLYYIVGPSGSGKSTLLRLLSGTDRDYDGSILIDNNDLKNYTEKKAVDHRKKCVSVSFQSHELEKEFTVFENVDDILSLTYPQKKARQIRVKAILKRLDIYNCRRKKINKLSGGEKARVNLARALGKEAEIYLLDEPLNGLNRQLRNKVTELIEEISYNHLVIAVTHQRDEIAKDSGILQIADGNLQEVRKARGKGRIRPGLNNSKSKFPLLFLWRRAIKKVLFNPFRAFCTGLTIMISMISFGLAFIISTGVAEEIKGALMSNIVDNALAVEKKNYDFISDERQNIDKIALEKLAIVMDSEITGIGNYYPGDFDSLFPAECTVVFEIDGQKAHIPSLSPQSFVDAVTPYEISVSLKNKEYRNDEIALGITGQQFKNLFPNQEYNSDLCEKQHVTLNLRLKNVDWGYDANLLFVVKEIILTSSLTLIHPNAGFADNLIANELELEVTDNLESSPRYPWTMKRQSFLIIKRYARQEFIRKFYQDKRFKNYDLEILEGFHLRYLVTQRTDERLDIAEIEKVANDSGDVLSFSYTSSFYHFGDDGLYAGFDNPFYLSADKSKINSLVDNYYITESPVLSSFNIKPLSNVIGGDMLGSMNKENFIFEAIDATESKGLQDKIIISSGLAEKLNFDIRFSSTLHYAYLYETVFKNDKYFHQFKIGTIEVQKIKEEKKSKIYQSPFFLTYFGLTQLQNKKAGDYKKVLIRFDKSEKELDDLKKELQVEYPDYYFSLPGQNVKKSIEPTMDLLKNILYFFAFFTLALAVFLLTFTLLLIVVEDRRSIITKYTLGYRKRDLVIEYGFVGLLSSISPGFSSAVLVYIIQYAFSSSLSSIMNMSSFQADIVPSILVFLLSVTVAIIAVPFIYLTIDKALRKSGDEKTKFKNINIKKTFCNLINHFWNRST